MKIAMIGCKGLPGIHGGVESHVEKLGAGLVAKGHEVSVYCRKFYTPSRDPVKGIRILMTPTVHQQHLDATLASLGASFSAAFADFDLIHYHAIGPGAMAIIPRFFGSRVVTTIHSQNYLHNKWDPLSKWLLRRAENMAIFGAHRIITVSRTLQMHLVSRADKPVTFIPNGVDEPQRVSPTEIRQRWGLEEGGYLLFVGRYSPEKGVDILLDAFAKVKTDLRLVLAGGAFHDDEYSRRIKKTIAGNEKIIEAGYVTGRTLQALYSNAAGFVLPSRAEGLPVALLEAMSYGLPCLASDIEPCLELGEGAGCEILRTFRKDDSDDLVRGISELLADAGRSSQIGRDAREVVLREYRWNHVIDRTIREYEMCLEKRS